MGAMTDWTQALERWHDFHLLIGTAGATLMGLTFVSVTLAPEVIADRTSTIVRAFTTPIVAFFATGLLVSLILLVPGLTVIAAGVLLALFGAGGMAYMFSTGVHRQWRELELGMDDWFWYMGFPAVSYGAILAGGIALFKAAPWALYAADAGIFALLIVGIRNAWDVVLAIVRQSQR